MILYIGNYGDLSGWARAAQSYILSMDHVGLSVCPKKIQFMPQQYYPERIKQLERNSSDCSIIIQHVLPHYMEYCKGRNIGLFVNETDSLGLTNWAAHLNLMDQIWVGARSTKAAAIRSGVKKPIYVVPHAIDHSRTQVRGTLKEQTQNEFLFYTIGELTRRKNLAALIKAYHLEFEPYEPVGLVIKSDGPVEKFCEEVRNGLRKYTKDLYKKEIIINGFIGEEGLFSLHNSCDVFCSASRGEGFCLPLLESMACAKASICTDSTSFKDLVTEDTGWLIPSRSEPCFGAQTFPDYNTGYENWDEIDLNELRKAMRKAYTDRLLTQQKGLNALRRSYDYTYEKVGNLIKELLDA